MRHRFATVGSSPTSQRVIDMLGCFADVIPADDAADAARLIDEQGVTAVLAFANLGAADGMRSAARVLADTALTAVPVILISRPVELQKRVDALRLGAGAVLDDGADMEAIEQVIGEGPEDERVEPLLDRSQHGALTRTMALLKELCFTGYVNVTSVDAPADIQLEEGRVTQVSYGELVGDAALAELLGPVSTVLDFSVAAALAPAVEASGPASALTVLFIDDDPEVRRLYRTFLANAGFEVYEAEDAASGVEKAREIRPDVVVTDLHMPKADGWRVIADLRSDPSTSDARIILHSAYHELLDDLARVGTGADVYVKKDGRAKKLVEVVATQGKARLALRAALQERQSFSATTQELTLGALLHDAALATTSARVVLDDGFTSIAVKLDKGEFVDASGSSPQGAWTGRAALALALGLHPARIELTPTRPEGTGVHSLAKLVDAIRSGEASQEESVREQRLSQDASLAFDEARLSVYRRQCAPEVRPLLSALRCGRTPRELIAAGSWDPLLVDGVVHDVMQRGIARAVVPEYIELD